MRVPMTGVQNKEMLEEWKKNKRMHEQKNEFYIDLKNMIMRSRIICSFSVEDVKKNDRTVRELITVNRLC